MYINKIKVEGIKKYVFDEMKKMSEYNFDNITKSKALTYAQNLCSRMMIQDSDEDIPDLLWMPYDYEIFDPEEIMNRLKLLSPDRGITLFVSQEVEKKEKDLQIEKWYGTKWCKSKIDDDFIAKLSTILPSVGEKLDYPPVNKYIPKQLIEKKVFRPEGKDPSLPLKISENPAIWFKQDDTFNQPFTYCELKVETTDCLYPLTPLSHVFSSLWNSCLSEALREIGYLAELAG